MMGIMSGYGVKIRQLREQDLQECPELRDKIGFDEKGKYPLDWCIAILGEDLAEGLASVIYVAPGNYELVWNDVSVHSGQTLTNIPNPVAFIDAVVQVINAVHPNIGV